jgi:hypothetical protein
MRRSAGLLLALFAIHLPMVAGGVVCVVPGMPAMTGAATGDTPMPMGTMPGMAGTPAVIAVAAPASHPSTAASASTGNSESSGPASRSCTAAMPCITALGADRAASIALPPVLHGIVQTLAVLVPASSASAPDIPPPRV